MKIENFNCPICAVNCPQKFIKNYIDPQTNKNYDLFQCSFCDAQFWNPLQNPGGVWYERDERYANRNIDPTMVPGYQHVLTMKFLNRYFSLHNKLSKNILDVGCGNGNFLAYAKKFGFTGTGFDFDRDGIDSGKRTFGIENLFVDDLPNYKLKHSEERYDLVTFFDVFEHIDNHNIFIDDVKSFLNPNGLIAMSIPHRDSASWLIPGDLPPRHLTRWNPSAIKKFLEMRGFEILKIGRIQATWMFIIMKLRWKYGKLFNFGLVAKAKQKNALEKYTNEQGKAAFVPKTSKKIKFLHSLARLKDVIFFGLPAAIIYLLLIGSKERYTDMYVIAKISSKL